MATVSGNEGIVKIGTTAVAKVQEFSITTEANVERDDGMSEAWQTAAVGKKRWTGTLTALYDAADAGQALVEEGDTGTGNFYPAGDGTGKKYYTGAFVVASVEHRQNQDDRVSLSISVTGNGALTRSTVA